MNLKYNIIVFSDFDSGFLKIFETLKGYIKADFVFVSHFDEIERVKKSIPVHLIIANVNNTDKKQNVDQIIDSYDIPIILLTDKVYQIKESDKMVFTFVLEDISLCPYLGQNLKSILSLISANSISNEMMDIHSTSNEKNLCRYIMEIDQKNEKLIEIKNKIDILCENSDHPNYSKLKNISKSISTSPTHKEFWNDFNIYFEQVNPGFIKKLTLKHPSLTVKDLKYCCYLKMNMSNNDIKNLLNINQDSVRTHKYRLKRKLGLSKEHSLGNYFKMESPSINSSVLQ